MSLKTYNKVSPQKSLRKTKDRLVAYGGKTIVPKGIATLKVETDKMQTMADFYIIDDREGKMPTLLGLPTCIKMNFIKKAAAEGKDPYVTVLQYRNAPVSGLDHSPAQLLMSRSLRTKLPTVESRLKPKVARANDKLKDCQTKQKTYLDRGAKDLKPLQPGDTIRFKTTQGWEPATIVERHRNPRSYVIKTSSGAVLRRNRRQLVMTNETPLEAFTDEIPDDETTADGTQEREAVHMTEPNPVTEREEAPADTIPKHPQGILRTTRSGRTIKPPARFNNFIKGEV